MFQYLLYPLPREKDTKFQQSQGDGGLGISVCLGCHIVETFSKMNVLTKQTKKSNAMQCVRAMQEKKRMLKLP